MAGPVRARRFDIADIVRGRRAELEAQQHLNSRQRRMLTDISQCRTEKLGGHREQCTRCDFDREVYLSCRNRHCPNCQGLAQEKWIEEQQRRTLNVKHFHVVFTLPAELRPLAAFASRVVYDILFRAASRTVLEFGERNLKATLGATLVLHTWTREQRFHPHVHAIVTAGGLAKDGRFLQRGRNYLFPVTAMAKVFRAKVIEALWAAYRASQFDGFGGFEDPEAFARLIGALPRKWNVYAKPSFQQGRYVLQYLGRYTHRVGLSNSRIVDLTDDDVTFRTRGHDTTTISQVELLRRLVRHVLPSGFHKIRHIGLNGSAKKRAAARKALEEPEPILAPSLSWQQRLLTVNGHDVTRCPKCRAQLQALPIMRSHRSRAPPAPAHPERAA